MLPIRIRVPGSGLAGYHSRRATGGAACYTNSGRNSTNVRNLGRACGVASEVLEPAKAGPSGDRRIYQTLKAVFGYDTFRPLQREIVDSVLRGQDVFVLMPTGGGKSLCYQLPALLLDGLVVVVSPLIALMKDQVDALRTLGVAATFINSSLDPAEIGRRQAAVARGDVKLLYVAPERLVSPAFIHLLASREISFFAIDEAHCISEWG